MVMVYLIVVKFPHVYWIQIVNPIGISFINFSETSESASFGCLPHFKYSMQNEPSRSISLIQFEKLISRNIDPNKAVDFSPIGT